MGGFDGECGTAGFAAGASGGQSVNYGELVLLLKEHNLNWVVDQAAPIAASFLAIAYPADFAIPIQPARSRFP
jgi:hypothetical protein